MEAFLSALQSIVNAIGSAFSNLSTFLRLVPTYSEFLSSALDVLPFGFSVYASALISIGVVKLILGRMN